MPKSKLLPIAGFLVFSILLPIIVFAAFQRGWSKTENYVQNGTLTDCTVVSVTVIGNTSSVQVTYHDAAGQPVTASATLNRSARTVNPGDHIQAYVLTSSPHEVLVPAGNALKIVCYGIMLFFFLLGLVCLLTYILTQRSHASIMADAMFTDARLLRFTDIQKTAYGDICLGEFAFTTESGQEVTEIFSIPRNTKVGENYQIMYREMPNGKVRSELIDERLKR